MSGPSAAGEFDRVNDELRRGAIEYGDRNYDEKTHLVARMDYKYKGRLDVPQSSPTYAAALLDAGEKMDRANAVIGAILDHQWTKDKGSAWYGNFIWWHDLKKPEDANAVAFLTPWLCYYLIERPNKITPENAERLRKALPLCLEAIRAHGGRVHYENLWFLKAACMVMLARTMDRPGLVADAEKRLGEWLRYWSRRGIDEYNSPCYCAVNIYAMEFILHYAPGNAKTLREKARRILDFLYADVFMNWHWEAGIGAGTHSRAYPRDRDTGRSLVSFLVYKQCGGELRGEIRSFEYNFVVNDYRVPDRIRAYAEKKGKYPLELRCTHPVHGGKDNVQRALYMVPEISLGTQTGHRVANDQAIPFKITYAGTKTDNRATYIRPVPAYLGSRTKSPVRFAAHQDGPRAVVLYEADMKGRRESAYLRLVIEPGEPEMLDEIRVNGAPYDRKRRDLKAGDVVAWRVADGLVAIRLLEVRGLNPRYGISPTEEVGLCLHGLVCYKPEKPPKTNDFSCGFAVRVGTVAELGDLAALERLAQSWKIDDKTDGARRDVSLTDGEHLLRMVWSGEKNAVTDRWTSGKKEGSFPLYRSPLINMEFE